MKNLEYLQYAARKGYDLSFDYKTNKYIATTRSTGKKEYFRTVKEVKSFIA